MFRAGSSTKKIKSYYQYLTLFRFRHAESDYEYAEAVLFGTRAALGIVRGGTTSLRVVSSRSETVVEMDSVKVRIDG